MAEAGTLTTGELSLVICEGSRRGKRLTAVEALARAEGSRFFLRIDCVKGLLSCT